MIRSARYKSVPIEEIPLGQIQADLTLLAPMFRRYKNLWLKGGSARASFMCWAKNQVFHVKCNPARSRDLDVVLITKGVSADDVWVAKQAILKAYGEHLDGVEVVSSFEQYFRTRDTGINEVLLRPELLVYSEKALRDVRRLTVHPSNFEIGSDGRIRPRVALRSILFALEEDLQVSPYAREAASEASPFDVALHLLKAYEKGIEELFFIELETLGLTDRARDEDELLVSLARMLRLSPAQELLVEQAKERLALS